MMMDITKIENPKFLKNLSIQECYELADKIRAFLIHSISKTGGHLTSNLGVVELTIALHKAFQSPVDKIFFDVGHQAYTHKILTGRIQQFDKLRQFNALSGFQKREESIHDVWEAGHSSTSLSAALGMAVSRDLQNEAFEVIPVIGDGALTCGMALEALNNIGHLPNKVIIVFNDNEMSISQNVGAITKGFASLRTGKFYNELKGDLKQTLEKHKAEPLLNLMRSIKNKLKDTVIDSGIFRDFHVQYLGPVDGHDIQAMLNAFEVAKKSSKSVVIHVLTQKGKGYTPCENDTNGKWHGIGPFNVETGLPLCTPNDNVVANSKIMSDALVELAAKNEKIVAITPAMISGSKLENFFAKYPNRSFDTGIAEEHALTFAAGLAISGMRPVVSIYSTFLQRAYDQLNHDICRMDLPVVLSIDRAGLVGEDGETHHGVFDISFMRSIPNIILSQPKDATEMRHLLYTGLMQNHPFGIRIPRGSSKPSDSEFQLIPIGSWECFNDSPDNSIVLITYGPDVLTILNRIQTNQMPITVINARFLKPLDEVMLLKMASRKMHFVTYEGDILAGGLSSSILEFFNDHAMPVSLKRFGIPDCYLKHGTNQLLKKSCHIDISELFNYLEKMVMEC